MVGVGAITQSGRTAGSSLARVSVVEYSGKVLLDCFVRQSQPVTDYRTRYSGIREQDVRGRHGMFLRVLDVSKVFEVANG